MTPLNWATLVIAIWGAVISSILAYHKIQEGRRNLNIFLEWQSFVEICHLVVVNNGKRPITIQKIIVRSPDDGWAGSPVIVKEELGKLPLKLTYGDEETFVLNERTQFAVYDEHYELIINDADGNEYRPTKKREYSPRYEGYSRFKKMKSKRVWEKIKKSR